MTKIISEAKPAALVPQFENVPDALTVHHRWLVWRWELRRKADRKEWTKPPRNARTSKPASVTDPQTWSTFEEAVAAYLRGGWDGVGIALAPPLSGVDLDDVVDPATGAIHPEALRIVDEMQSYTEISPSGRGLRIFTHGALPRGWRNARHFHFPIEVYDSGRYLSVTGAHRPDTPLTIKERTPELAALHARVATVINSPSRGTSNNGHRLDPPATDDGLTEDEALLERARHARSGDKFRRLFDHGADDGEDHSAADLAVCGTLAFWTQRDAATMDQLFRRSALMRAKWDERHCSDGRTYGQMTIAKAIASCRDVFTPGAGEPALRETAEPLRVPDAGIMGIGRDFADLHAAYLESPRSFFYFAFLTYFGSLIAKKVTLASALAPEPRLYTVLLGESADTRKSTALRVTDQFFRSLGLEWEPHVLYGVGSAEGMAAELKECPDLLLHYDEFKSFVDKAKNEHSVTLPMVASLFERGDYDNRTKTERVSIRGASLSLLAACTTDTYATMFDQRFFSIGLLNRLFIVTDRATACIPVPKMIPEPELDGLRQRVRALLQSIDRAYVANGRRPVAYTITADAEERFNAWYASREGSIFERRLDTYGHRLMVLLAATSGHTVVELPVVEAVLPLLRYQLDARRECDPVDAENTIAGLEEKIRRTLKRGAIKRRELQRKVHYNRFGLWAWNKAIDNLLDADEVLCDRKTDLYWLAPVTTPVTTEKRGLSADEHRAS